MVIQRKSAPERRVELVLWVAERVSNSFCSYTVLSILAFRLAEAILIKWPHRTALYASDWVTGELTVSVLSLKYSSVWFSNLSSSTLWDNKMSLSDHVAYCGFLRSEWHWIITTSWSGHGIAHLTPGSRCDLFGRGYYEGRNSGYNPFAADGCPSTHHPFPLLCMPTGNVSA